MEKRTPHDDTSIGELFIRAGAISEGDLRRALSIQEVTTPRRMLGQILIEEGFINDAAVRLLLAQQHALRAHTSRSVADLARLVSAESRRVMRDVRTLAVVAGVIR